MTVQLRHPLDDKIQAGANNHDFRLRGNGVKQWRVNERLDWKQKIYVRNTRGK